MSFARYADDDFQEKELKAIERIAKKLKFVLRFGTKIGKSPQTVILDHHFQDGLISVSANSEYGIEFNNEKISISQLKNKIEEYMRTH